MSSRQIGTKVRPTDRSRLVARILTSRGGQRATSRCAVCGRRISPDEAQMRIHGVQFHTNCGTYEAHRPAA